ncbi:MAG TPA: hypothetical protein QGF58_03350 [Myxococcota bacterium]|nr:hypothetical protein [Myxococcota bacterium]
MILLVASAFAAELSEADAERIARLYYQQLGKPVPTAFLDDDIEALLESDHSAAELEKAVRYIVAYVEGADAYTLSGILESHLAAALDYEEDLVLPEGYDPNEVLGEVSDEPLGYAPGPAEVEALLVLFYEGSGRRAPDPALEADLAAFERLTEEGWNREGIFTLVSFVPDRVQGAELLTFAEAVDVALDQGYLGGPRPRGGYDELEGVEPMMPMVREAWVVERVPRRFDGGRTRSVATTGALPAAMDRMGAELPGTELRVLEARSSWTFEGTTTSLAMGEARDDSGFVVEGLYSQVVPGRSDVDGVALDGGPTFQDDSGTTPLLLGGRGSVGRTITGIITIPGTAVGATAWGYTAAPISEGGANVSLRMGQRFSVVGEAGIGGIRQDIDDLEVIGQLVQLRATPRLQLDGGYVEATWRGRWNGGGLLDDAPPIFDDEWAEERHHVSARAVVEGDRYALGIGAAASGGSWSLQWVERDLLNVEFGSRGDFRQLEAFAGAEARVWRDLWLMGGTRWVRLDGIAEYELAAGTRVLVREWVWVEAEVRGPREPQASLALAFPF